MAVFQRVLVTVHVHEPPAFHDRLLEEVGGVLLREVRAQDELALRGGQHAVAQAGPFVGTCSCFQLAEPSEPMLAFPRCIAGCQLEEEAAAPSTRSVCS